MHSCLIWMHIMQCLCHKALLHTGLLCTYPIIVQRYANVYSNNQQNIFDAYHLVDLLMHV